MIGVNVCITVMGWLVPPQKDVHVWNPRTSDGTLSAKGSLQMWCSEGSEMRSPWRRVALHPMTGSLQDTEEERCRHRGEAPGRQRQRREGRGPKPRDAWSPQKLEEAGRTLPWSFWREHSRGTPWSQTSGLHDGGRCICDVLSPQSVSHLLQPPWKTHTITNTGSWRI